MLRRWRRLGAWRFQRVRPRRSGRRATSGTSHATAFRDTRRVHRPALCRQSAGGRARRRRPRHGCDAGDRPRVQPSRDGVRAAAAGAGAPRAAAHLHAGARTAVRRPSDGRHRGAARAAERDTGGRRTGAGRRRSARCVARWRAGATRGARVRFVMPQLPERIGAAPGDSEIAAGAVACARRHRLRPIPAVALVGRQCLHLRAGRGARRHGRAARSGTEFRGRRSAPAAPGPRSSSAARPPSRATISTPACSRRRWASSRIRRPARPPRRSRACSSARPACRTASHALVIEQGYEMGRPSLIHLSLTCAERRADRGRDRRRRRDRDARHDRGMTILAAASRAATIVRLDRLELAVTPRPWAFAHERRDEIDRHFAHLRQATPELWNGRMLLLAEHAIEGSVLRGSVPGDRLRQLRRLARLGLPGGRGAQLLRHGRRCRRATAPTCSA